VASIAGSNARPAILNSRPWNRGRDGRLSQLAVESLAPARLIGTLMPLRGFVVVRADSCASAAVTLDARDTPNSAARRSRSNRERGRTHVPLDYRPGPNKTLLGRRHRRSRFRRTGEG